jgi:branched-chain amino acid transport system ATP-binding protein
LDEVANSKAGVLSMGIIRRLEVGRALAVEPRVLLLDEPSSGLDVHETIQLGRALNLARQEWNLSMVLVEHDLEFVLGMCQAVSVLDFGLLIAEGSPEQVRTDPNVQAAYIGTEAGTDIDP